MDNNHEIGDLKLVRREPWNKGKLIGAIPATKGLTALWPTIGMFLGFGVGIGLLARLVATGVNLSVAIPLVASALPLSSILFGVAFLGESASALKIALLVSACGLVLIAGYVR